MTFGYASMQAFTLLRMARLEKSCPGFLHQRSVTYPQTFALPVGAGSEGRFFGGSNRKIQRVQHITESRRA